MVGAKGVRWALVTASALRRPLSMCGLTTNTEPITSEFLQRNFKDGNRGELYRVDDEWWFKDDWEHNNRDAEWRYKGTDDPMRYRFSTLGLSVGFVLVGIVGLKFYET